MVSNSVNMTGLPTGSGLGAADAVEILYKGETDHSGGKGTNFLEKKMFDQNLDTNSYKNQAAKQIDAAAEASAQAVAT